MILADTSIWIELLRAGSPVRLAEEQLLQLAVCPPVIQEVLQGLRDIPGRARFEQRFLALPCIGAPAALSTFLHAADISRLGRKTGITVRSSVDCLIAAIAIENRVPVWHRDRDFGAIARYTALREWTPATA